MSLFTDSGAAEIEYLRTYESGILDVAAQEGIELDAKLALAASQVGDIVLTFLTTQGSPEVQMQRRRLGLTAVVVTPALRRWHAAKALELTYRDAYGSQLNDRYGQKMAEYAAEAKRAEDAYFAVGAGLVARPVRKAALPDVSAGSTNANQYAVRVSMVNSTDDEGEPSDAVTVGLDVGSTIAAQAVADPAITGWNVYLGATADSAVRQNAAALALGTPWTFSGTVILGGALAGSGQAPDHFLVDHHVVLRG